MADAQGVYELMAAGSSRTIGEVVIEEADIVSDWQRPASTSPPRRSVSSTATGERPRRLRRGVPRPAMPTPPCPTTGDAASEPPSRCGRSGSPGATAAGLVGMPAPRARRTSALPGDLGYEVLWTSWVLAMPRARRSSRSRSPRATPSDPPRARPTTARPTRSSRTPSSSGRSGSASPTRTSRPTIVLCPASSPGT